MSIYTVSGSVATILAGLVSRDPERVRALYRQAELAPDLAEDADARVPCDGLARLAGLVAERIGSAHGGLRAFGEFTPGIFGMVGFAMMTRQTLLGAIEALMEFLPLLDESVVAEMEKTEETVEIRVRTLGPAVQVIVADLGLAALMGMLRMLNGGRHVPARSAMLSYPEPEDISMHRQVLGCHDIQFGAPCERIVFDRAMLDGRLLPASPEIAAVLNEILRARKIALGRGGVLLSTRVRGLIAERLGPGEPTIAGIAAECGLTARALQRALQREETSFNRLLDETRRQIAHLRLQHSNAALKQIGYDLGYEEQRSFHRACLRWFGVTPGVYRRQRVEHGAHPRG